MFLFRCCSHRSSDDVDRESTLLSQKEMSKEKVRSCGSSAKRLLYHQPGKKMYGLVSHRHADLANANVVTGSEHATNAACETGSYEVGGYCLALLLPETRVETSLMNTAASGSLNDVNRHRKCTCETSASSSAQLLEDDSDAGVIGSDNLAADEEEEVCFSKHSRSSTRWSVPCDTSTNGSSCSTSGHDSFRKIYTASGIPGKRISGSHQCESPDTGISWSSPDIASTDEMLFPTNPFIITLLSEEFRKLSSGPCHASANTSPLNGGNQHKPICQVLDRKLPHKTDEILFSKFPPSFGYEMDAVQFSRVPSSNKPDEKVDMAAKDCFVLMNPVYDNVSVSVNVGRVLDAIDKFSDGLDDQSEQYVGAQAKEASDRVQDVLQQSKLSQCDDGNRCTCGKEVHGELAQTRCDHLFGAETNCELVEINAPDSDCLHHNTMGVCDTTGVRDESGADVVLDGSRADLVDSSDVTKVGEDNTDDNYVSFHHFASAIVHKALDEAMRRNANSELEASAEQCEMTKSVEISSSGASPDRPTKIDSIETPSTQLLASSSEGDCVISDSFIEHQLLGHAISRTGCHGEETIEECVELGQDVWMGGATNINQNESKIMESTSGNDEYVDTESAIDTMDISDGNVDIASAIDTADNCQISSNSGHVYTGAGDDDVVNANVIDVRNDNRRVGYRVRDDAREGCDDGCDECSVVRDVQTGYDDVQVENDDVQIGCDDVHFEYDDTQIGCDDVQVECDIVLNRRGNVLIGLDDVQSGCDDVEDICDHVHAGCDGLQNRYGDVQLECHDVQVGNYDFQVDIDDVQVGCDNVQVGCDDVQVEWDDVQVDINNVQVGCGDVSGGCEHDRDECEYVRDDHEGECVETNDVQDNCVTPIDFLANVTQVKVSDHIDAPIINSSAPDYLDSPSGSSDAYETASSIVRAYEAADAADVTRNDDRIISSYDTVDPVMWAEVDNDVKYIRCDATESDSLHHSAAEEHFSMKDQSCDVRDAKDMEYIDGHLFSDNRFDTGNDVSAFYLPFVDTLPYDVILSKEFTSNDETIEQTTNEDSNLEREFPSDIPAVVNYPPIVTVAQSSERSIPVEEVSCAITDVRNENSSTGSASVVDPVSTDVVMHDMECSSGFQEVSFSATTIHPVPGDTDLEDERQSVRVEHLLNHLLSNSVHPESWGTSESESREELTDSLKTSPIQVTHSDDVTVPHGNVNDFASEPSSNIMTQPMTTEPITQCSSNDDDDDDVFSIGMTSSDDAISDDNIKLENPAHQIDNDDSKLESGNEIVKKPELDDRKIEGTKDPQADFFSPYMIALSCGSSVDPEFLGSHGFYGKLTPHLNATLKQKVHDVAPSANTDLVLPLSSLSPVKETSANSAEPESSKQDNQKDLHATVIGKSPEGKSPKDVNDVDEEVNRRVRRPSLVRRSTSLKTSPTDTPRKKKEVKFADSLGLDLESVRHILNPDDIPDIVHHYAPILQLPPKPYRYLHVCFSQPGTTHDFIARVKLQKVLLESCLSDDRDLSVSGCVRVWNLSYRKDVTIRYTTTGWGTFDEVHASYVNGSNDRNTDRFSFAIILPMYFDVGHRLEFAIRFNAGENLCREFWDNNNGANYSLECESDSDSVNTLPASWLNFAS